MSGDGERPSVSGDGERPSVSGDSDDDLVRQALARARGDADARIETVEQDRRRRDSRQAAEVRKRVDREVRADLDPVTGKRRKPPAGPQRQDIPEATPITEVLEAFVRSRRWTTELAVARVTASWPEIVGSHVAGHCRPVALRGGELTLEATSTAWATQLRLLGPSLLERIAAEVGAGVVTVLHVRGPSSPTWQHGRLRVPGRGPRDTYG